MSLQCDDSFPCHRCRQKGKECFKPSILSRDVSSSPGSDVTTGDLDRFRNLHTGAALDEQNHSDGSTGTWRTVTRLPDRVRLPRWQKASPEPGLSKVRSCSSLGKRYLAFIQGTFLKSGDRHCKGPWRRTFFIRCDIKLTFPKCSLVRNLSGRFCRPLGCHSTQVAISRIIRQPLQRTTSAGA